MMCCINGTDRIHRKGYKSKAYFVNENWYVDSYTKGKINEEGKKYLVEISSYGE